jgi:TP901 family phage tail tape measure protein
MPLTVAQLVARLTADTSGFYRGMAIANSAMLRSGGIITRVAAGAGLATLGMGIMSLRAAGNFEQSMNILGAVSQATTGQMNTMRGEAIKLGADMKLPNVSAKDAADAMQELAKGGLSVNQIMGATRGTLQLGLAANIGFADSATIVARALQAFKLDGGKAVKVADLFAAAANRSTADMTDLALGFQMASAQFAAGDQTIQGLTTSLALMANAGIIGSDAGTSLKTMMNRLMAPTQKAKDLMGELGFKVYDASGNMKSMPNLIGDLETSLKGMSKEQRNAALYTIFGSDAIRASRVMLNAGEKGWRKMQTSITKGGEATKLTEARTKGFNGALQAFGSTAETLAINLGTAMLPAMTSLVRWFTKLLAAVDPNAIIGFFTAIKDGVVAIYDFISGSDALVAILGGLAAAIVAYKTVMMAARITTLLWAAANFVLSGSLLAALSIPALVAAALIGLAAALYIAYQRSETFRAIVQAVFGWLKSTVPPIVNAVKDAVITAFEFMATHVSSLMATLKRNVQVAWAVISAITKAVWGAIGGTVTSILRNLRTVIVNSFNIFRAIITAVWNQIKSVTSAVWNTLRAVVTNVIGVIRGDISKMQAFKNIVSTVWNGIKAITRTAWANIKSVIKTAVSNIPGIISGIAGAAAAAAFGIGSAIVSGILSGVAGLAGALKSKVSGMIGDALGSIDIPGMSPPEHAGETIGRRISAGLIRGIILGGATMPDKISDVLKKALERGQRTIETFRSRYETAFSQLTSDAMSAFDAMTSGHQTPAEKILNAEEARRAADELASTLKRAQAEYAALLENPEGTEEERIAALKAIADAEWAIRKAALEQTAAAERKEYEAKRELRKRHFEEELAQLQAALAKHPERHKQIQRRIIALLNKYGVDYKSAGLLMGTAFAQGMRESMGDIRAAARDIAKLIERILKLRSPAREGPLSDLDTWWNNFASTLVSGIDMRAIENASNAMAGVGGPTIGAGAYAGASAGLNGSRSTIVQVTLPNAVLLGKDKETARQLADIIAPEIEGRIAYSS